MMIAREITPILNVSDLPASLAWFDKLGWRTLWEYGEPTDTAAVATGECAVLLSLDGQGGRATDDSGVDRGMWLYVVVDNVDALHDTCVERGVDITRPPADEPWGSREMHLRHPDGHVLRVAQHNDPSEDHVDGHPHEPPHTHVHP